MLAVGDGKASNYCHPKTEALPVAPITYSLVVSTPLGVGITHKTVGYWGYRYGSWERKFRRFRSSFADLR